MMIVDQLVVQHQALRNKAAEDSEAIDLHEIMALMDQVRAASTHVENGQQREQLQAILFHWNGYVHSQTGSYPGLQLAPFAPLPPPANAEPAVLQTTEQTLPQTTPQIEMEEQPAQRTARVTTTRTDVTLPQVHWLVWALAITLFVGGALILIWPLISEDEPTAAAAPTVQAEVVFTAVAATQTTLAQEAAATRTTIQQTANAAALLFVTPTNSDTAVVPENNPSLIGPVLYVVQMGDTLFAIARRYGITPDEIMSLNGLSSESLTVGQTLTLPHPPLTPETGTAVPLTDAPAATIAATAPLPPGQQLVELVIRTPHANLYSGPGSEFSIIMPVARGTFAFAVGRSQAGDWILLQLEDGVTRGWLPANDVGFLYPAVPENIPVITTP